MTDNHSRNEPTHKPDPYEETVDAWKVLVRPDEYRTEAVAQLFERGYDTYRDDNGHRDREMILEHVEKYTLAALDEPDRQAVIDDPWVPVSFPGRLAVLHTLGTIAIKHNEQFSGDRHRVRLHKHLREAFVAHLYAALVTGPDKRSLQQFAATTVYRRTDPPDKRGPPPGPTVTGIYEMEEFGGHEYFEIPMVHANQNCISRIGDPVDGPIETEILNNCLYVPVASFEDDLAEHIVSDNGAVATLESLMTETMTNEDIQTILQGTPDIDDKIYRLHKLQRTDKLYERKRYPKQVRILLKAVSIAPNSIAELNEWITAEDILEAVTWFVEEASRQDDTNIHESEIKLASQFDTPVAVGKALGQFASDHQSSHPHQDHVEVEHRQGKPNLYRLEYLTYGNYKEVDVSSIEDILELPCMQNIHDYLRDGKPTRYILYQLVRIIFSIRLDGEQKQEFDVDDIVEWFDPEQSPGEGYPWFDEDTTRYQSEYERQRRIGSSGKRPNPVGCNNDNHRFSQFCIGKENCDYSIYQSLPFKQDVYDRLPDDGST